MEIFIYIYTEDTQCCQNTDEKEGLGLPSLRISSFMHLK